MYHPSLTQIACLTSLCFFLSLPASATNSSCQEEGSWYIPAKHAFISTAKLVKTLRKQRVVLLGELHDVAEHHRWQLQTISALFALREDIVLGFEMFPRRVQPVLDRWVAGELSESEFLAQSDWRKVWGYDSELYMPLFHFARINRIPMLALNIERSVLRTSSKKGLIQMTREQREGVSLPAPASDGYLELLADTFVDSHDHDDTSTEDVLTSEQFIRFADSQQLWDRAMAEKLASAVKPRKSPLVIGIMGAGHIVERFGVPHQLADLGIKKTRVLLPSTSSNTPCDEITSRTADSIFGLAPYEEKQTDEKPLLGVHLFDENGAIKITQVVEQSVAENSGLKQGDTFVTIAGRIVDSVDDVVDTVQAMHAGTWLPIEVNRDGKSLELVAKFPANDKDKHN